MKYFYVNMGIHRDDGSIISFYLPIIAQDEEEALDVAKALYPRAMVYFAQDDLP